MNPQQQQQQYFHQQQPYHQQQQPHLVVPTQEQQQQPSSITLISHSDFECPLCLQLLYDPVGFHCGHTFCRFCIERLLATNGKMEACPCCRAPFCDSSGGQIVTLNHVRPLLTLRKVMPLLFGDEYTRRGEAVERERQEFQQTMTIRKKIYIGNQHAFVNDRNDQNVHKWTLFVRMDDNENIREYIESVEVKLHPTFKPSRLLMKDPPFELTRYGWGYFTIGIKITFKDYLNKPPYITSHTLSFDGDGAMSCVDMDFMIRRSAAEGLQNVSIFNNFTNSQNSNTRMADEM